MGKIVVIGGGEIRKLQTIKLDKRIVELTRKKKPNALFLPTASGEPQGYIETFNKVYGQKLGCKTDTLLCLSKEVSKKKIKEQIKWADLIYVGGGNTLKMVRRWRHLGIDKMLKQAHKNGTVLSGLSAGGVCWFDAGHSDSMSFYNPKKWKYIKVKGIGVLNGIHCPHFDSKTLGKSRKSNFIKFMRNYGEMGIGIDDQCAIEFIGDKYRVITAKKSKNAYKVYKKQGKVKIEIIPISKSLRPIKELYVKN